MDKKAIEGMLDEANGANPHTRHLLYLKAIAYLLLVLAFPKKNA